MCPTLTSTCWSDSKKPVGAEQAAPKLQSMDDYREKNTGPPPVMSAK
jgi:hypothetical protein